MSTICSSSYHIFQLQAHVPVVTIVQGVTQIVTVCTRSYHIFHMLKFIQVLPYVSGRLSSSVNVVLKCDFKFVIIHFQVAVHFYTMARISVAPRT